jgi:hypothetical protein
MVEPVSETMNHFHSSSSASLENLGESLATFEGEMARTAARMHRAE